MVFLIESHRFGYPPFKKCQQTQYQPKAYFISSPPHPERARQAGRATTGIISERVTFGPPISPLLTTTLLRLHQINEININNNNGAACGQEIPPGAQDRLRVLRRHLPRDEHDHRRGGGDQIGKRQDETSTIALREQNLQNFARRT